MRNPSFIAAVCLTAFFGAGPAFAASDLLVVRDSVVAVVNKQVITQKDILDRSGPAIAELERDDRMSPEERRQRAIEIHRAVLRQIVDEKLLIAEGNRLLNANETIKKRFSEDAERRLEEERRKMGAAAFREMLRTKGLTDQAYADHFRDRMLMDYVRYEFVGRDLSVAPREVLEYYQQNLNQFGEPATVKFRSIFIPEDERHSRDAARQSAQEILLQLKKGTDFALLAGQRSALRAAEGGLWDFTEQGTLPKPADEMLFSLPVGGIGGPVETEMPGPFKTENGFLIVKVEERTAARTRTFEEVQQPIEEMLLRRKQFSRFDALIRRLEAENYVEYVH